MNSQIFQLLATFPVVYFQVAHTTFTTPTPWVVTADGMMQIAGSNSRPAICIISKIAEVRFRANEAPVVYYEF